MIASAAWTATVVIGTVMVIGGGFCLMLGMILAICAWADRVKTRTAFGVAVATTLGMIWLIVFAATLCYGTVR